MPSHDTKIKLQLGNLYRQVDEAALQAGQTPADWIRDAIKKRLGGSGGGVAYEKARWGAEPEIVDPGAADDANRCLCPACDIRWRARQARLSS